MATLAASTWIQFVNENELNQLIPTPAGTVQQDAAMTSPVLMWQIKSGAGGYAYV